jgi:cytochrome c5
MQILRQLPEYSMTNRVKVYKLILFMCIAPIYADTHHPQEFLKSISGAKNEGEQIYNHFCVNCHAQKPLIPIGAPRIEVESDWELRLKQDVSVLYIHTDEGFNSMPPRGGCFECTDQQLILATVQLVPKRNKKVLLNELLAYLKSKK